MKLKAIINAPLKIEIVKKLLIRSFDFIFSECVAPIPLNCGTHARTATVKRVAAQRLFPLKLKRSPFSRNPCPDFFQCSKS